MGSKSLQKKQYIIAKAREVFSENGYRKVTMKDIVEACDISRGGLYLYFSDIKSLFEAVLVQEQEGRENALLNEELSPGEALLIWLEAQKSRILGEKSLAAAIFEYLFAETAADMLSVREETVSGLEKLITRGVLEEWMVCENPAVAARHIVYVMDGLCVTSQTFGVTMEEIDQEIEYIMGMLGMTLE